MRLPALALLLLTLLITPAGAAPEVGGYTNMSYSAGHGSQVEYLSPKGTAWLWYPGNSQIVVGKWKRSGASICFAYGQNTYNPVTGRRGGDWECMEFRLWWWAIEQRVEGDPLHLEGATKVPFKLGKQRGRLDKLVARLTGNKVPLEVTILEPGKEAALSCKSILANAERSKSDMSFAIGPYFHGIFMGDPCGKVDYDRAFDLMQRTGTDLAPYLRILRDRAANGNRRAAAALERYGP